MVKKIFYWMNILLGLSIKFFFVFSDVNKEISINNPVVIDGFISYTFHTIVIQNKYQIIFQFTINNHSWICIWNPETNIMEPIHNQKNKKFFFIKINNKLIKVFFPEGYKIKSYQQDFFQKVTVDYTINGISKTHENPLNQPLNNITIDLNNLGQYIYNNSLFYRIIMDCKNKFIYGDCSLKNTFYNGTQTIIDHDQIQYNYQLKNNFYGEIIWNKVTKKIINAKIYEKNNNQQRIIYEDNIMNNQTFDSCQYPKFSLLLDNNMENIISSLIYKVINPNIKLFFLEPLYPHNEVNYNFKNLLSTVDDHIKYGFFIIPIIKYYFYTSETNHHDHILYFVVVFERQNNLWILKKNLSVNSSCNDRFFLFKQNTILLHRILDHQNNNIMLFKEIFLRKNHSLKNTVLDNFFATAYNGNKYFTPNDGNTFNQITDCFNMRQIGYYFCYVASANNLIKGIMYLNNQLNNPNTNHLLDNKKLNINDLMYSVTINLKEKNLTSNLLINKIQYSFIGYLYNINIHNIQKSFLININLVAQEDFGQLINENLVVYKKEDINYLRNKYDIYLFYNHKKDKIYSYIITRDQSSIKDLHFYKNHIIHWLEYNWKKKGDTISFDEYEKLQKNYRHKKYKNYINLMNKICLLWLKKPIEPPIILDISNLNKNHTNENVRHLFYMLQINGLLPFYMSSLLDISALAESPIYENIVYEDLITYNLNKIVMMDYEADCFMALIMAINRSNLPNKDYLLKILTNNL